MVFVTDCSISHVNVAIALTENYAERKTGRKKSNNLTKCEH